MRSLLAAVAALFCMLLAAPAAAGPCEDLAKQIAAAPIGSIVRAPAAAAGCDVRVARGITLTGGPVRSLVVTGSNVTVDGLAVSFTPDALTVASTPAVRVTAAANVRLLNLTVTGGPPVAGVSPDVSVNDPRPGDTVLGYPTARGLWIERSTGVLVENCRISTFHRGIGLYLLTGVTIRGCEISDIRTSFISGSVLNDALVEGNRMRSPRPWKYGGSGDHGDFAHFWTDPRILAQPSRNIVLRRNWMDQGDGAPIMGIYLDDNGNGLGFVGAVIEGNTIISGHAQGILLENAKGAAVNDNLLLQSDGADWKSAPSLRLAQGSTVTARGNRMADTYGTLRTLGEGNDNEIVAGGVRPAAELATARWAARRR